METSLSIRPGSGPSSRHQSMHCKKKLTKKIHSESTASSCKHLKDGTNEKIHNRSKQRVAGSAGDDCSGPEDHVQRLGEAWPADPDQWRQASSSKPPDSRNRAQAWAAKRQAASHKLDTIIRYKKL